MANRYILFEFPSVFNFSMFLEDWKEEFDVSNDIEFLDLYNWVRNIKKQDTTFTMSINLGDEGIQIVTDDNDCWDASAKKSKFVNFYLMKMKKIRNDFYNFNELK